jgi:hypothetical protein
MQDHAVLHDQHRSGLPITARGPDGIDLKIPRWMSDSTAPAGGRGRTPGFGGYVTVPRLSCLPAAWLIRTLGAWLAGRGAA